MSKATFVCLFLSAAVLVAADFRPSRHILHDDATACTAPPEGVYLVQNNVPTEPGNDTLVLQAMSLLSVRKGAVPDFYTGSGGGVAFNSMNPLIPRDSPLVYNFAALFDRETCIMSGAFYIPPVFVDPIQFFYDGNTLSGDYVNVFNDTALFTTRSHAVLTPIQTI